MELVFSASNQFYEHNNFGWRKVLGKQCNQVNSQCDGALARGRAMLLDSVVRKGHLEEVHLITALCHIFFRQ